MGVRRTCNTRGVEPARSSSDTEESGLFEDAKIDRDRRLVIACADAPDDTVRLSEPKCLRAVLARLRDEPQVSGVVLVQDRERECGPDALAALRRLLAVGRLLDQFAERPPSPEFPGFDRKEVAALCTQCEFRPGSLFPALRDRVLGDPQAFVASLLEVATSLDAYEEAGCHSCAGATRQDFRVLIEDMLKGAPA